MAETEEDAMIEAPSEERWCDSDVPWRDRPWPRPVTYDDCGDLTLGEVDVPPDQLGRPVAGETDGS